MIVADEERGAIDNEADVGYQNASGKLDYNPTDRVNLFLRAGVFDEERNNGKIGELNDTNWKYGNGGVRHAVRRRQQRGGAAVLRPRRLLPEHLRGAGGDAAAQPEQSDAREDRADQDASATMVQWAKPFQLGNRAHLVTAGTDFRWIDGDSDELTYTRCRPA